MNYRSPILSAILLILTILIASCSQPVPTSENDPDSPVVILDSDSGVAEFQILIVANDMEVGTPRIPIIVRDGPNMVREIDQIFLTVLDINEEPFTVVWEGPATNFSDYAVPYWVFYPEIEKAGNYGVQADILLNDGATTESQFAVAIQDDAIAPAVGDPGFPSESRTAFDAEAIKEISSDFQNPDPEFYRLTLAEALSNGRPTVISFSTPSFCATAFCAPVLETMKEVKSKNADFDYIHIEVFANFETLKPHQTINEWQLQSEPWTYVLDANGIVTARFGGPVSPSELGSQLVASNQ